MSVQAILFEIDKWSTLSAKRWLRSHGFKPIKKVHTTDNYHRFRIKEPRDDYTYAIKDIGKGIKLILITN